jgi:hypothetical protein
MCKSSLPAPISSMRLSARRLSGALPKYLANSAPAFSASATCSPKRRSLRQEWEAAYFGAWFCISLSLAVGFRSAKAVVQDVQVADHGQNKSVVKPHLVGNDALNNG